MAIFTRNKDKAVAISRENANNAVVAEAVTFSEPDAFSFDVADGLISDLESESISDLFKVLGDTTRIKILKVLYLGETSVSDIARALSMSASAISHQLRVLKSANIVKYKKQGKQSLYFLSDSHIKDLLVLTAEHITETDNERKN